MMRLPVFRYLVPQTLEEAASMLADDPERARIVAGGTDLFPNMKRRHQHADTVISLRRLVDLRSIRLADDGEATIGAMTTLTDICEHEGLRAAHPGFVRAVATISTPVLRNMGTIGGNVLLDTRCTYYNQNEEWRRAIGYCMKEAGEVCWVAPGSPRCWAISASDSAPLLCAIGARVRLVSKEGAREVPIVDLYQDDGIQYLTKRPDEILTEIVLPAPAGTKATYWKLRRRGSIDFPVLGVAAAVRPGKDGAVEDARIFLGAVRSFPTEATDAARSLVGQPLTESTAGAAAALARKPAAPLDNTDFVVNWRKTMVERYVDGVLRELGGLPARIHAPHGGFHVA